MKHLHNLALAGLVVAFTSAGAVAQSISVSLGVRETGNDVPIGSDGGTGNGIEWIDKDLNSVALDGTWQLLSFNLADPQSVTAFAGVTANSLIENYLLGGTIEHLRLLNVDGIDQPIRLWLDDLVIAPVGGAPVTLGWEGHNVGDEVIFQEPAYSGSTIDNLVPFSSSLVTDTVAYTGDQSLAVEFQFVDDNPTRWVRLTTFDTAIGGNPAIPFSSVVSFRIRGEVVPEPASAAILILGACTLAFRRRRR